MSEKRKKKLTSIRFTSRELATLERLKGTFGADRNQTVVLSIAFTYTFWPCVEQFCNMLDQMGYNKGIKANAKERLRLSAQFREVSGILSKIKADDSTKKEVF